MRDLLKDPRWQKALAAMAAVLATIGVLTITISDDKSEPGKRTITIRVDGSDQDGKRDDKIVLSAPAEKILKQAEDAPARADVSGGLRDVDVGEPGVLEGPLAAQEFPGCRTRHVGNFSGRGGQAPKEIVWHQTVSRERGWASQDGLTAMAARLSSGVSWHFLIGRSEGRCTFTVPLNMKAWTQGNANPFSIGIEVEAFGDEGTYVTGAGKARLLAVTRELGRRFGIPMRRGLVQNCRPVRSGIVEHSDLGACGGGHADVTLAGVDPLIAELGAARARVSATSRVWCRKLQWWRNQDPRPRGKAERNAIARRHLLEKHRLVCVRGKVRPA